MKVIIAGGREATNPEDLLEALYVTELDITEVVCGGAKGADTLGRLWAKQNNIDVKMFPANWNKFGKSAGYKRNVEMAEYADALIALWDGKSRGTKHMIDIAKRQGLTVEIYKLT